MKNIICSCITNMKVLVTGASGLLGRQVYTQLKESKLYEVIGTCFKRTQNGELTQLDLTRKDHVTDWFEKNKVFSNGGKPSLFSW